MLASAEPALLIGPCLLDIDGKVRWPSTTPAKRRPSPVITPSL